MLFPESEQQYIADMIGGATYRRMTSVSGHDAFLIQQKTLGNIIQQARILP
jgi:homoserine acetyltransferase